MIKCTKVRSLQDAIERTQKDEMLLCVCDECAKKQSERWLKEINNIVENRKGTK